MYLFFQLIVKTVLVKSHVENALGKLAVLGAMRRWEDNDRCWNRYRIVLGGRGQGSTASTLCLLVSQGHTPYPWIVKVSFLHNYVNLKEHPFTLTWSTSGYGECQIPEEFRCSLLCNHYYDFFACVLITGFFGDQMSVTRGIKQILLPAYCWS